MPPHLFDFTQAHAAKAWHAIDDRVMGGASRSRLRHDEAGHATFEGEVSLLRNGGFASVRSSPGPWGRAGADTCVIEIRGPDRPYKISLLTDNGFDALQYQADFAPAGPGWQTLDLPLSAFCARFRGRDVVGAPVLDPARIRQLGLMTATRQAGPFALDIRRIDLR